MPKSLFLDAAVAHLSGQIDAETFHDLTARHAFRYVLDLFHRLPAGETSLQFYVQERRPRRLVLTDELLSLTEHQRDMLAAETEARWSLVEHVWTQHRDGSPVNRPITYDPLSADLVLIPWRHEPRKRLTPLRPSLSGYQKGLCFYCFGLIDTTDGQACHVDHFFPWRLGSHLAKTSLNSVWNLVLACPDCNSGPGGKHDAIPVRRFLERLHRRNSYLIDSHHPLRETLLQDTGTLPEQRWAFLKEVETTLLDWQPLRWTGLRETFPMF